MLKAVATLLFWVVFMGSGMLTQGFLLLRLIPVRNPDHRQKIAQNFRLAWSASTLRWFFRAPSLPELQGAVSNLPQQFILVCNHRSNLDPLFVFVIGRPLFFLSKKSVLKTPVIGWWMRLCGDVPVERGDKNSRGQSLEAMRGRLNRGDSLLIFPEGTRQIDPNVDLGAFKDGAFNLAAETGVPLVALVLHRTDSIMGKNDLFLNLDRLRYKFSQPITTAGETAETLKSQTVEEMTKMIQALRT
jgi:1-acyl-sn-glycerol-3-phosphate acyltransferase